MPPVQADFAGVIKGKKTVASLRDAVDIELARAKIEANATADRIQINMQAIESIDPELNYTFLFADAASILLKANDDFMALAKIRIGDHKAAEAKRLEAEREKIRAEEQAKLQREQQAKEQARAREPMPDTKGDSSRTGDSAPGVVTSGNERPSGGFAHNSPAPAAAPSDKQRGLYNKFLVEREDGSSDVGEKHFGCDYFVLDLTHDRHAIAALFAYADSCQTEYPLLAQDLRAKAVHLNERKAA